MKKWILLLPFVMAANLVLAEETASLEEAQKAAKLLAKSAGPITDAPFRVHVDLQKPHALKNVKVELLVIPDLQLKAEQLAQATTNFIPVGELWMRSISPMLDNAPVPNARLRLISLMEDNKEARLQVFLLAARKTAKGGLELVVFGRETTPLLSLPLKKTDSKQTQPVEFAGKKNGDPFGTFTLKFFGKYEAEMPFMKAE